MASIDSQMLETLVLPVLFIPIFGLVVYVVLYHYLYNPQRGESVHSVEGPCNDRLGLILQCVTLLFQWCGFLAIAMTVISW